MNWAVVVIEWQAASGRAGAQRVLLFKTYGEATVWIHDNNIHTSTVGYDIVRVEDGSQK